MEEQEVKVPFWMMVSIYRTMRMVATTYDCKERDTCLKRNVMQSFHYMTDLLGGKDVDQSKSIDYYMTAGLEPENLKLTTQPDS